MTDNTGTWEKPGIRSPNVSAIELNPTSDSKPSNYDAQTDVQLPNPNDTGSLATSAGSDALCQPPATQSKSDHGTSNQSRYGPFLDPDPAGIAGNGIISEFQNTSQADEAFLASYNMSNLDFDVIDAYAASGLGNEIKAGPVSGLGQEPVTSDEALGSYDLPQMAQFEGDPNELPDIVFHASNASSQGPLPPIDGLIPNPLEDRPHLGGHDSDEHQIDWDEAASTLNVACMNGNLLPSDGTKPRADTPAEQGSNIDSQLFCSDNDEAGPSTRRPTSKQPVAPSKRRSRKRLGPTKLSAAEKRQKLVDTFNYSQDKPQRGNKSKKQPAQGKKNLDINTLVGWNTINAAKAAQARAHADGRIKPLGFSATNRKTAIAEMKGQVPGLDKRLIQADGRALIEACTLFKKPPRPDGEGGWLHPNMNTSLFHYQLLGAGFMRSREDSVAAPHGGFLCDDMGFGKTIQAIANIVDGRASDDDPVKTTLIVVPPHLVTHWKNEVMTHVKDKVFKMVASHHSKHRLDDHMIEQLVENGMLDILITTYGEVRRSCPKVTESPVSVVGKHLQEMYSEKCGILHRIKFRRIIIDEGHEIKNHASKTSRAVRTLSGRYRWVITGTPIHNSVDEFFPYFDFTRIPQTGTFEQFRRRFNPENAKDRAKLSEILGAYMFRRTHEDTMFGHPILNMPDIEEQTCDVLLCKAERHLYRELMVKCIKDLLASAAKPQGDRVFRSYLTLLLRLRMFTSHSLVASKDAVKELLTSDIIRSIRAEIADEAEPEDLETCYIYEKLVRGEQLPTFEEIQQSRPLWARGILEYGPRQRALITRFRSKLNANESAELQAESLEMTKCKKCKREPFDGYITSCMHVVCHPCHLALNRKKNAEQKCGCGETTTDVAFYHTIESLRDEIPIKPNQPAPSRALTGQEVEQEVEQNNIDWVDAAGHIMKGGKLKAVRCCIREWFNKSREVKVVLFTQFLDMVAILCAMCAGEGWGFTTLTGQTGPMERDRDVQQFRDDPSTRIMISSLRAGGTGLNLTMATRCVLIDLWWNEAIEQQAFCRLYRIGQECGVEFVRLTAKNTIDDRLQKIQQNKTEEIDKTMGPQVISTKDAIDNMLRIGNMGLRRNSAGDAEVFDLDFPNIVKRLDNDDASDDHPDDAHDAGNSDDEDDADDAREENMDAMQT